MTTTASRQHILIDACVAAAHFAQKSTSNVKLRERSTKLLKGRPLTGSVNYLIPNFCIAEVFAVLEKYRWGKTWNPHVSPARTLTPKEFSKARSQFRSAIHNGAEILQVDLNRYHILAVDLVSPINNAYKIKRDQTKGKKKLKKNVNPAKTYDMLIVAMGIWLQHQFGAESFTVVTGDDRLAKVVDRAKSIRLGAPMKKHLAEIASGLGLTYSPSLYPTVIDLAKDSRGELLARFPDWSEPW